MTKIEVDRESGWEEFKLLEDASDLRAPDYEERLERSRMRLPHRHLLVDLGANTAMRGWYSLAMDTCTKVDGICYPVYVKRADDEPPMYLYRTLAPNDLPLWQISYGGGKPEDILAMCVTDCKDPRLIEEYWLVPEFCQKTGQVTKWLEPSPVVMDFHLEQTPLSMFEWPCIRKNQQFLEFRLIAETKAYARKMTVFFLWPAYSGTISPL
jgi:hypothetical protein